ncbi:hypothetical protein BaRGS_00033062, partial [Batillaria attramentaria]
MIVLWLILTFTPGGNEVVLATVVMGSFVPASGVPTPSLQSLPSTSFNNGFFTLSVPNPVVSGEYSCLIDDNSAASVCIQSGSPLRGGATISVDGKEARFNLTEARYQQEIAALQQKIIDIENKHQQELAALKQENADKINELKANITALSQVPCDVLSYERGLPSGVYMVPIGTSRVSVYCDQDTDNGGWTVIQRRLDGSVDFYRYWRLRNIYTMTSHRNYRLRVDLEDFGGNTAYADYNHFSISGPSDNYRLSISGFNGTT